MSFFRFKRAYELHKSTKHLNIHNIYLGVWRHPQSTTIGIKLVDITQLIPNTFLALGLCKNQLLCNSLYKLKAIIYTLKGYHLCILFNHIRCLYLTLTFMLVPFKVIIKVSSHSSSWSKDVELSLKLVWWDMQTSYIYCLPQGQWSWA